jgi:hypothetical protein
MPILVLFGLLVCRAAAQAGVYVPLATHARVPYFDAHNHFTGILPYYAYANLPAFVRHLADSSTGAGVDDRLALYRYLSGVWYPAHQAALGNRLFSPPEGQRYSLGARATLVVYADRVAGSAIDLDGALERVLTATPWSEFDSAYAFRGGPANEYLLSRFYAGAAGALNSDLCRAALLDLAATNIEISEQSLPFVGGWAFDGRRSERLDTIECAMNAGHDSIVTSGVAAMHKPMPLVKFVLMTHTSELAALPGATQYSEWSKTGHCEAVALPNALRTTPATIYHALLGHDPTGTPLVAAQQRGAFYDTVVGIDTAGPETTCFTPDGMAYYQQLAAAVYGAAKARRADGWHGKLLIHTHVGEGGVIDYAPVPPAQPWTFATTFASFPSTISNADQPASNITALLGAIAQFERAHPDARNYVVFRMAHDTWANEAQAAAMHDEGVEADVNLESNFATGAYALARMPVGLSAIMQDDVAPLLASEDANLALNDLLGVLIRDPNDELAVGSILGNASLKYLLEKRVRCLLGTDAGGVEHSDIVKEYALAAALIAYWNESDPTFRSAARDVSQRTLFDNVRWHLTNMSTDAAVPY